MTRHTLLPLFALLAAGCADPEDSAEDTADTAGDTADTSSDSDDSASDTGNDTADTGGDTADSDDPTPATLPTYDAEAPSLSAAGWVDYNKPGDTDPTGSEPPAGISASYARASVGVFRPTTTHLQSANPLAGPAGGSQTYFLSVNGMGTANPADVSTLTFVGTDAMEAGKVYTVSWTWARRKDIGIGTVTSQLLVDGMVVETDSFSPTMAGIWYTGAGAYEAQAADAGKQLSVRITHSTQFVATYQVLVDQVMFQSN